MPDAAGSLRHCPRIVIYGRDCRAMLLPVPSFRERNTVATYPTSVKRLDPPEAAYDRPPLGSPVLAHALNLADALSRLTFSPLTLLGMSRRFTDARWPAIGPGHSRCD